MPSVQFINEIISIFQLFFFSWQTIMPNVRVENVEDEECYNFILLKCPTVSGVTRGLNQGVKA